MTTIWTRSPNCSCPGCTSAREAAHARQTLEPGAGAACTGPAKFSGGAIPCSHCGGSGLRLDGNGEPTQCPQCQGSGQNWAYPNGTVVAYYSGPFVGKLSDAEMAAACTGPVAAEVAATEGLLPCPFCGGEAVERRIETGEHAGYIATVRIKCTSCLGAISARDPANLEGWSTARPGETEAAARAAWNRRPADADLLAANRELARQLAEVTEAAEGLREALWEARQTIAGAADLMERGFKTKPQILRMEQARSTAALNAYDAAGRE